MANDAEVREYVFSVYISASVISNAFSIPYRIFQFGMTALSSFAALRDPVFSARRFLRTDD